jgi:hypothetical protein
VDEVTYPIEGPAETVVLLRYLPPLNAEEAGYAWIYQEKSPSLWRRSQTLGNPSINGRKSFSTAEILRLGETPAWLDKATKAVINYWWVRNHGDSTDHVEK